MAPAIRLRNVVALLGRYPALAGLDADVAAGEVVLVQGPNGAGKSTFLRVCAGLVRVQSGEAEVLGVDVTRNPRAVRSRVGLLSHASMLYDDLSVAENVLFWARLCGVEDPGSTRGAGRSSGGQVEAALERLGIADISDRRVGSLSAGQRRRTSIAATVIRRPELWLLDEPHAGLDQAGRDVVDSLIADAIAAGATVLVASHELDRVRPIATKTLTIAGGAAWERGNSSSESSGQSRGSDHA